MPQGEQMVRGQGSGFIVSPDGVILTNAHVVSGADVVKVKLTDKREFTAKVIGIDKPTDVAVLKIDATGLPTVPLGDPSSARVGDWVLAIGSPFGFENSVTAGHHLGQVPSRCPTRAMVPFIQTDVAVNPGNSGGPLLNLRGSRGYQFADLFTFGRLPGSLLRHPDRCRGPGQGPDPCQRQGHPRSHGE